MSYEKYFKDVSGYDVIDVYRTHRIFGLNDEVLCHASKKLLLSGVRTGGKTLEQDVKEARDTLTRWLEMLAEDLCNEQESDGWTPEAIESAAFKAVVENVDEFSKAKPCEYTLGEVVGDAVLSDWAEWVAVDKNGGVFEYSRAVIACSEEGIFKRDREKSKQHEFKFRVINKLVPPLNFENCIFEVKK
ncbi:MAG: hypothetical protein GXZ10_13305 [Gammaproteobacteria bacterium]|nr:hypothetical protein [Gammaproteobacteria bacterium]